MDLQPIPQLPSLPILGNVHLIDLVDVSQSFVRLAREHGPIYEFKRPNSNRLIVIGSAELVAELSDDTRFEKDVHKALVKLQPLGGDGLFTAQTREEAWGRAHRVLMPAFGPVAVRSMFDQMQDICDQMLDRWERFGAAHTIDVADDMTRLTLDTIALCAFDFRFNSFYRETLHPFVGAMVDALAEAGLRTSRPDIVSRLLWRTVRKFEADVDYMNAVADGLVAERRRMDPEDYPDDLLSRMLRGRDPVTGKTLPDQNIRYQLITFLIAGHETTSGLLSFATYFLLKHPEVLERARTLVDDVVGEAPVQVQHLEQLGYLEQILKECLRLWPTAPAFAVHPFEKTVLGGRYEVFPDDTLLVFTPVLHRDPEVWDDPDVFRPERFDDASAVPEHAYKPFGNGQRACIGRAFALQEAVLVLASVLQRFDIAFADPAYELVVAETLTLKPGGLEIVARPRRPGWKPRSAGTHRSRRTRVDTKGRQPLHVLYGSDTGTSETFARQIAAEAGQRGFTAHLARLDDRVAALPTDGPVVVVTASYLGEPTRDARKFVAWLREGPGALQDVAFAVFGCGDRNWAATYQAVPTFVHETLVAAGAEPIVERGEGDASADLMASFDAWRSSLWSHLAERYGTSAVGDVEVDVRPVDVGLQLGVSGLAEATVLENRELVDMAHPLGRSKRHVVLQLPEGMIYEAGDYLTFLPVNPPASVGRALARYSLASSDLVTFSEPVGMLPARREITAGELFARYVELGQPASRAVLERLLESVGCPPERPVIEQLLADAEAFRRRRVSVLDLLERCPSISLALPDLVGMLPPLRPRVYSISSSPKSAPGSCTLTVAVVRGAAHSGFGDFEGVASSHLARLRAGERVLVRVTSSPEAFGLPEDPSAPLLLVAAGSGMAPMRGFIEERMHRKRAGERVGPTALFFGCDHPDVDLLYREELEETVSNGVLELFTAFTHAPEGEVRFVQDRLLAERGRVVDMVESGAYVLVCGGEAMARGVREALRGLLRGADGLEVTADPLDDGLVPQGRYVEDVFS